MRKFRETLAILLLAVSCIALLGAPFPPEQQKGEPLKPAHPLANADYSKLRSALIRDARKLKTSIPYCKSDLERESSMACDSDHDRLSNGIELWLGSNPKARDSDNDGISDRRELVRYRSDPLDASSPNISITKICTNKYFDANGNTTAFKIPRRLIGNIAAGNRYQQHNCLSCHGERGLGLDFSELQIVIDIHQLEEPQISNLILADLVANLNRDLMRRKCLDAVPLEPRTPSKNEASIEGPPSNQQVSDPSPLVKRPRRKKNSSFDNSCKTVLGKFKIPQPYTGKIKAGSKIFFTTCSSGACHLGGEQEINTALEGLNRKPNYNVLKKLAKHTGASSKRVSVQRYANIVAFLNRRQASKRCQATAKLPEPTPTPAAPLPNSCDPEKVFEAATTSCISCHSSTTRFGGFTINPKKPWGATSTELRRAIVRVGKGDMPPAGAPALTSAQHQVFSACLNDGDDTTEDPPLLYNPGDPAATTSRFTTRRLSKLEYSNSLKQIYGNQLVEKYAAEIGLHPEEDSVKKFSTITDSTSYSHIAAYLKIAKAIATEAVTDAGFISRYPCLNDSAGNSSSATFINEDRTTKGNWPATYGGEYYRVAPANGSAINNSNVSTTITNSALHTWSSSTQEARSLLTTPQSNTRIAAAWYSASNFTIEINSPANRLSRLAIYLLDFDTSTRSLRAVISDKASGKQLDSRSFSSFSQGAYGVWDISGPIKITITSSGSPNATVSGIFVGTSPNNLPANSCLPDTIAAIGRQFFRRPLRETEITRATSAYDLGLQSKDRQEGFISLLSYLSQSPSFLYHLDDTVESTGALSLTEYGIANRMAFTLTKSPPDAILSGLADAGQLKNSDVRRAQALRLLATTNGQLTSAQFGTELVGAQHISPPPADANFLNGIDSSNLVATMRDDVSSFFNRILSRGGSFKNLMTDHDAQVDSQLAAIYGLQTAPDSLPSIISLDSNRYAGILTRAGTVSRGIGSSPFHLAQLIDRNFLSCSPLSLPPNTMLPQDNPLDPNTAPGLTLRQRLERVTGQANCIGCHRRLNFIFASGNYDSIGRWITTEMVSNETGGKNQVPLNTTTRVFYPGDSDGKEVNGPVALSQLIAQSTRSAQCFYLKWGEYSLGRNLDPTEQSWILEEPIGASHLTTEEIQSRIANIIARPAFINIRLAANEEE